MATTIEVAQFTSLTATGDQDIDIASFGVPDAVIFLWSGENTTAASINTATDDAIIGIGFADGTRQYISSVASEHGLAS